MRHNPDAALPPYAETLPDHCPPDDAQPPDKCILARLSKKNPPTKDCFKSYAALGKPIKDDTDPCEHASCSTYIKDVNDDFARAIVKLPHFKKFYKFVHFIEADHDSGAVKINARTGHVDLWMYYSYNPISALVKTEPLK